MFSQKISFVHAYNLKSFKNLYDLYFQTKQSHSFITVTLSLLSLQALSIYNSKLSSNHIPILSLVHYLGDKNFPNKICSIMIFFF